MNEDRPTPQVLPYCGINDQRPIRRQRTVSAFLYVSIIGVVVYGVVLGVYAGELPDPPALAMCTFAFGASIVAIPGFLVLIASLWMRRYIVGALKVSTRGEFYFGMIGIMHTAVVLGFWHLLDNFGLNPNSGTAGRCLWFLSLAITPIAATPWLLPKR